MNVGSIRKVLVEDTLLSEARAWSLLRALARRGLVNVETREVVRDPRAGERQSRFP